MGGNLSAIDANSYYLLNQLVQQGKLSKADADAIVSQQNSSLFATNTIAPQDTTNFNLTATQAPAAEPVKAEEPKKKKGILGILGGIATGAVKAVGGMVCSVVPGVGAALRATGVWKDAPKFSPLNAAIAVGAIALTIACPPAGVALAVAGGVIGGAKVIDGGIKLANADNAEEQEAAAEEMGGGFAEVGLSIAGGKASFGECANATEALNATKAEGIMGTVGKAKNIGKGLLEDTKVSLKNNTTLGENIIPGFEKAKGFRAKVKAVKDGTVKTAKESDLYENIRKSDGSNKVSKVFKGTGKTLTDTINNLRITALGKLTKDTLDSNNNLAEEISKLDGTKNAKVAELLKQYEETNNIKPVENYKDNIKNYKDGMKNFRESIKNLDEDALPKETRTKLEDLAEKAEEDSTKLLEKLQKAEEEIAEMQEKYDAKMKETSQQAIDKKAELDEKVKAGEITKEAAQKEMDEFYSSANKELEDLELTEEKRAKIVTSKFSATSGAKENLKNWAETTSKENAKPIADRYNETAADEFKVTNEVTKEQIAETKKQITEVKEKIEETKKATKGEKGTEADEAKLEALNKKLKVQNEIYDVLTYRPSLYTTIGTNAYTPGQIAAEQPAQDQYSYAPQTPMTQYTGGGSLGSLGFVDGPGGSYSLSA